MGSRRACATRTVVLAVGLATALGACSGADDVLQVRATDPSASTSSATSSAAASGAVSTRGVSTPATAPWSTAATSSTGSASSAPTATATVSSTGSPASVPASSSSSARTTVTSTASRQVTPHASTWPKPLGEPQQGQPAWAVYLAIGHGSTDPVVETGVRQAAGVNYSAVVADVACDVGAMEALKLDQFDLWTGATVYFRTQADARAFAASYTQAVARPKGIVQVKIGCLD